MSSSSSNHRRNTDMRKLMNAGYNVQPINNSVRDFLVDFNGPPDSLYAGGLWKVYVELTEKYPDKSPTLRFITKIFHPNIHFKSGLICVNLLDSHWNSEFDLVTVFDMILPQLLLEPNPFDSINEEAADLLQNNKAAYDEKVKEYRD